MNNEVNISVLIDEKLKEKFEKKCDQEHRSMSSQIRFLIEKWLGEKNENRT